MATKRKRTSLASQKDPIKRLSNPIGKKKVK
jgi:hypothetical protein